MYQYQLTDCDKSKAPIQDVNHGESEYTLIGELCIIFAIFL